jgi:hypothetical protein
MPHAIAEVVEVINRRFEGGHECDVRASLVTRQERSENAASMHVKVLVLDARQRLLAQLGVANAPGEPLESLQLCGSLGHDGDEETTCVCDELTIHKSAATTLRPGRTLFAVKDYDVASKYRALCFVAALLSWGALSQAAYSLPTPAPGASATPSPQMSPAAGVTVGTPSALQEAAMPYGRFTEGATSQPGLFTVWRKQGKVYFEIGPDQLDHPYLLVPILASGLGRGLFAGLHFRPVLWQFSRVGNQIFSLEQNPYGKAAAGSPASLAVRNSFPQSVMSADPITAIDNANGHIVFGADALLTDIVDLTNALNSPGESRSRYSFNPRLSYFGPTKVFPTNVDVEADLTMSSTFPGPIDTVPDARNLFIRMHYSLVEMPNDGYRPRIADDRLGYFITARRQYDNQETQTSFVRYINRWNIVKSDPRAAISPAKNPIVYYLSNDIPVKYRRPITRALLTWNKAFEKIGISHAIKVVQQPADPNWDLDDARYSVVRWVVSPDDAFAYGPAYANPLTGEIFRGDIVIDGNLVRFGRRELEAVVDPTRGMSPARRLECSRSDCDYGYEALDQARWANLVLQTEGVFRSDAPPPRWFVNSFLESIVLHESGHTLGLRHNFESSNVFSRAQLHDKAFTEQHGLVGSVMDYTPVNLSPHGQPQGSYFQTRLGSWDYFSILYGYEPIAASSAEGEVPALRRLGAQTTRPELRYATDEDNSWGDGFATDPRVHQFALSADALGYASDVLTIDQRLFNTLQSRLPRSGESYAETRDAFAATLRSWGSAARFATHYIGGEYFTRNHRGDPGATLPFTPVPRVQERRAFALLDRYVFSDNAFRFSPALLNSLGEDRFRHWQSDPNVSTRLDFPLDEYVQAYQLSLLYQMWQPNVLARLAELESRVGRTGDAMSLADLFDWTDASVWGDLSEAHSGTVPRNHRRLQHEYAEMLVRIMLRPDGAMPTDAQTLARHHLNALSAQLATALRRGQFDQVTTANFEDIKTLVDRALQANVTLPM